MSTIEFVDTNYRYKILDTNKYYNIIRILYES